MLIDGHAYIFEPMDSAAGYPTIEQKMQAVQQELSIHHQPVWRVRDRARADNSVLADPDSGALHQVTWGRDKDRLTWTYEGETYTKQYLPPMLNNLEMPAERLIAEMDYAGVDLAILHNASHLGRNNKLHSEATSLYPDRLKSLVHVPETDIPSDPSAALKEVEYWLNAGGVCGLQFFTRPYSTGGFAESWNMGPMREFWQGISSLGLPVYFTVQPRAGQAFAKSGTASYLSELDTVHAWMQDYPNLPVVLTHGLSWGNFRQDDRIILPEAVWRVFESDKCNLQLLFPIQLGGIWQYPFKNVEPTVEEIVQRIGSDHVILGTDLPMVARFWTYRQTIDQYRVHCPFLSDEDRANILGATVARIHNL